MAVKKFSQKIKTAVTGVFADYMREIRSLPDDERRIRNTVMDLQLSRVGVALERAYEQIFATQYGYDYSEQFIKPGIDIPELFTLESFTKDNDHTRFSISLPEWLGEHFNPDLRCEGESAIYLCSDNTLYENIRVYKDSDNENKHYIVFPKYSHNLFSIVA